MLSSLPPGTSPRPPVQSLWIGATLSTMERLSIASFLAQGHPFHLYTYGELQNVPAGTTLLDARSILPEAEIFVYTRGIGKGSYAAFSDLFRYAALLDRGGWWVDLDVVALRPFEFDRDYVFGYESPHTVCTAVFHAPRGSKLVQRCYQEADRRRGDIEWGEIGPALLTRAVHEFGLAAAVEPMAVFHPVDWRHVGYLVAPGGRLPDASRSVHLIRHFWRWTRHDPDAAYPPDCIYERLKTRYLTGGDE